MIIHIDNRQKILKLNRRRLRAQISKLMKILKLEDRELSLVFMDNKGIQEINRDYLGRDRPTNVISFAISEGEFNRINPQLLGDIIISAEQAVIDAESGDLPVEDELSFLIIHGLLHLIGYDHEGEHQHNAPIMMAKERELFKMLTSYGIDLE
ncbi:MAG: Endoribonuclease YbeY [Syntrophus sp. SKADARSKE-3]|nr:Endoribonuclease YbeY [Syntrophus sp. SKADARSKE-3]